MALFWIFPTLPIKCNRRVARARSRRTTRRLRGKVGAEAHEEALPEVNNLKAYFALNKARAA